MSDDDIAAALATTANYVAREQGRRRHVVHGLRAQNTHISRTVRAPAPADGTTGGA